MAEDGAFLVPLSFQLLQQNTMRWYAYFVGFLVNRCELLYQVSFRRCNVLLLGWCILMNCAHVTFLSVPYVTSHMNSSDYLVVVQYVLWHLRD